MPFEAGQFGRRERKRDTFEMLEELLHGISRSVNRMLEKTYGMRELVNSDCTVNMDSFLRDRGGIYSKGELENDKKKIHERELHNSRIGNPIVRKFREEKYRTTDERQLLRRWKEETVRSKSSKMEMAAMALLHKMLGEKFIAVRTATYDDYHRGGDNLIVNKETGEVVGALDEVHEGGFGGETRKEEEKMEKVAKIAKEGGAKMRYGLSIEQGRLKRAKLEHVPVFYFRLTQGELERLLADMNYDPEGKPTAVEYETFGKLLDSLERQIPLLSRAGAHPQFIKKLQVFQATLNTLRSDPVKEERRLAA